MKVNMNGMRSNMMDVYNSVIEMYKLGYSFEEAREELESLRSSIAGFMCLYDPNDASFSDMSEHTDRLIKIYEEEEEIGL